MSLKTKRRHVLGGIDKNSVPASVATLGWSVVRSRRGVFVRGAVEVSVDSRVILGAPRGPGPYAFGRRWERKR